MTFEVILANNFKKEAKRLIRRYSSLKIELELLGDELKNNPTLGISLGNDVYKIGFAIKSKGKGKSEGGRVITYVKFADGTILLLPIYDKGEKDSISD